MEKKKEEPLEKLMKLTKLMKDEKVVVKPKGPSRSDNKWRSKAPKFDEPVEKKEKPDNVVQGGGMEVDPARKEEYDNWRRDKEEEMDFRRSQSKRKAEAARIAREAENAADKP